MALSLKDSLVLRFFCLVRRHIFVEQIKEQIEEQKNKRNRLDPQWFSRIMKNGEKVGISQTILQRFDNYYLPKRRDTDAKSATSSSRVKSTSN